MNIVKAPFPANIKRLLSKVNYKKRTVLVCSDKSGHAVTLYSYWDGGSRDQYMAIDRQGRTIDIPVNGHPQFSRNEATSWFPAPGDALIKFGTTMGKPATIVVTYFE